MGDINVNYNCEVKTVRPENALARLNPKTQKYETGFGGIGGFSQADLSMCIGGLTRLEYIYAEHSLIGVEWEKKDETIAPKNATRKYLEMFVIVLKHITKAHPSWIEPKKEILAMAVMVALYEAINPRARICKSCNGTGSVKDNRGHIKAHRLCNGSGKRILTGDEYAKYLGVKINDWRRTWQPRYMEILSFLFEVERSLLAKVSKKLLPLDDM